MKVRIKIYGLVQGVFFRISVIEKARELNVFLPRQTGHENPQNMPDGTIEIITEGKKEDVSRLTEWCKTGPELAKVEKIEIIEL